MSDTTTYYYYMTNDNGTKKIGVVDEDMGKFTGTAKVFYSKLEELDTREDANEPTIDDRWHWALVYGALWLMGYPGVSEFGMSMYRKMEADAKSSGKKVGTLTVWNY